MKLIPIQLDPVPVQANMPAAPRANYRKLCWTLGIAWLAIVASGALGVVFTRQQTSQLATVIRQTETAVDQANRRLSYFNARVAQARSPERLGQLVAGELTVPTTSQVVWVQPATPGVGVQGVSNVASAKFEEPQMVSFDLALIQTMQRTRQNI